MLSAREEMSVFVSLDSQRARISVTRAKFEELTADLLDRTLLTVRKQRAMPKRACSTRSLAGSD